MYHSAENENIEITLDLSNIGKFLKLNMIDFKKDVFVVEFCMVVKIIILVN